MSKAREYWLKKEVPAGEYDEVWKVPMPEKTHLHVIEKSAYYEVKAANEFLKKLLQLTREERDDLKEQANELAEAIEHFLETGESNFREVLVQYKEKEQEDE